MSSMNDALERCADGLTPPNVALMHLFIAARDEAGARTALQSAIESAQARADAGAVSRLLAMRDLWADSPQAYEKITTFRDRETTLRRAWTTNQRVRQWASFFDRAAADSAQFHVVHYTLANERLHETATRELGELMRRWSLFDARSDVLDLGCGPGRCLELLSPQVHSITGLDISEGLLRVAAERTARLPNVRLVRGSGRDLTAVKDQRFHLIIAVDSFPYLVKARVAHRHIRDCAALLNDGGHLLIFNYSYRSLETDRADIRRAAQQHGLVLLKDGTRDLELWDGIAFLMQKRRDGMAAPPPGRQGLRHFLAHVRHRLVSAKRRA